MTHKRIALGLAVAAFAAPLAQARVDEGIKDQPNSSREVLKAIAYRSFSSPLSVTAADVRFPRAMPSNYALARDDQIEVVRAQPKATSSDKIEFVRTQPRSVTEPQLAGRFVRPNTTTGDELASWNVNWDDAALGAGVALALVLLGGGAVLVTRQARRVQTV